VTPKSLLGKLSLRTDLPEAGGWRLGLRGRQAKAPLVFLM